MAITADVQASFGPAKGAYLRIEHVAWMKASNTASYALVAYASKDTAAAGLHPIKNWSFQFNPAPAGPVTQAACYADAKARAKASSVAQHDGVRDLAIDDATDS